MFDKIKQFFTLFGIFALIAIFYITKKKFEINSLKKLLEKDYKARSNKLTDKRKDLKKALNKSKGKDTSIQDTISTLDKDRRRIKNESKKLDSSDLSSAIDKWYKSRD
ncbi:hypothetical protein CL621_00905 [archaeon]|nr:hypothetical protein [archaeon]|tara:strand:- start:1268 stop:1591 length:324 start_codon:yes stop_codon:yes gene_type:complete